MSLIPHPRARHVTVSDRAAMLLGAAADAAENAAHGSGNVELQMRAAMLRAMTHSDMDALIRHAQTMRAYHRAQSA